MEKNKKKEPELKASDKQTVEAFAKKKKRFIIEKLRDLSVNHEIANKYLAEAIAYSTSLRTLIIEGAYLTSKHWKVICEGIVKNKNSIESLIFSDYIILEDDALEVVDQIFRWKKIRFVHLMNFSSVKSRVIEKFVDSMNNCNTLERVTMSRLASYHSVHYFFGCLRNKLVKKFKLTDSALTDDQIGALARFINNSNVTNLHLGVRMSVVDLTPIISASNCVKKLTLNNNVGTTQEVELLINAMKTNTRISTLKIIHDRGLPTDPIHFAEQMQKLLKDTKTIQSISLIDRSMTQYVIDGIFSNTSLTALDLTVMSAELYEEYMRSPS